MMSGKHSPNFTYAFTVTCILVFFGSFAVPTSTFLNILEDYAVRPASFAMSSSYVSLITYMFFHADLTHLLSNMFTFFNVGRAVESEIGTIKFGMVFLGAGAMAGFAHTLFNQGSGTTVIGASGAIFGAIAILLLLMPFKFTSVMLIPIPGVVLGLGMLAVEIMSIMYGSEAMIAHDVHLYGFVAGSLGAFGLDYNRAMRGLIISILVVVALYYWSFHMGGFSF